MASSNPLSTRLEELRSRNPQSPPSDNVHSGYTTPTRYSGSFLNSHTLPLSTENRAFLQRRFTADSNNTPPALAPIGYQPTAAMEPVDTTANVSLHKHELSDLCNDHLLTATPDCLQSPSGMPEPLDASQSHKWRAILSHPFNSSKGSARSLRRGENNADGSTPSLRRSIGSRAKRRRNTSSK